MFPMTVALERVATHFPRVTAMMEEDGRRETWREHIDRVARLAGGIAAAGLAHGSRYAVLAPNSVAQATLIHAGYWSGRVPVPLNYRLSNPELSAILKKSNAKLLFTSPAFLETALSFQSGGWDGRILLLGPGTCGLENTDDLINCTEPSNPAAPAPADEAILLFTGGTTGEGKGVPLTHANVVANGLQVATALGAGPDDLYLHVAPMFHSADLLGTAVTLAGGGHSYIAQPSPESIVEALETRGATMTMTPPVLLNAIVDGRLPRGRALEKLRIFICGGAPVPFELLERASEMMPATAMIQGYGMTETAPILSFLHVPQARALGEASVLLSSGKPLAGVETRLFDQGPDAAGELAVRGPNVFAGYLDRTEDTAAAYDKGWFRTGDMARIDDHGFLHVLDRKKDMIISGGENIYSVEVETVLLDHPDITDAAVFGIEDPLWGERVVAVIVPAAGCRPDPRALSEYCRAYLGGFKIPRDWRMVGALPKSALGKTLKAELRARFWDAG